ncbi:hypothetical protein Q4555_14900 [Octadecabacter sp. 1_MG-2023]|uniref:hypothetical protein n=1 Tax=unclassified Octadecabacter TaxID=196158 RepID=UPI001C0849E2|nr:MULTISPECIES: hypothetical protein [unclassified Octadecabacter]MBU2991991.1 hypothetical protein [Octadecabacter sp. B2R22]MDO6735965.1 hypothetical protein [Octadecabacter sp. 1_MG-2023]
MNTKNQTVSTVFLIVVFVLLGGAAVLKGGLYVGKHEGDTLHLIQIVLRMADGQIPHLDFMTPIGVLAFWPIAMLVKAGFGIGMAVIWAQVLAAVVFLPMVIWIAGVRMQPWLARLFGLIVMVMLLALVHGESEHSISISMHYNRLAWAAAFLAIVAALIPPNRDNLSRGAATLDGMIIGLLVCVMALIKMTYFVSFAIPIVLALVLTGQRRALGVSVVTGLAVVALITAFTGVDFWMGYAGDLLAVAGSEVRSAPGQPFSLVMGAPAYLGGSIAAVLGVVFLRQAKVATGGLVLLLLLPGFFYVTFQNFGNDPQWLLLLAVLLLALRPQAEDVVNGWGWNLKDAIGIVAAIAMALAIPSFFNLASSPFRHLNVETAKYAPILPRSGIHTDLQGYDLRVNRVDARVALDGQIAGLAQYPERSIVPDFMGVEIPTCAVELGLPIMMDTITRELESEGLAQGKSLFAADVFSSHWVFGELEPLDQGAPWYYGGAPGLHDADYVLLPLCPVAQAVQKIILDELTEMIEAGDITLTERRRTELYILYDLDQ